MVELALALVLVLCALGFALAAVTSRLCLVRVEGESMLPTLHPGDTLLCRRYRRARPPRTGEVVMAAREGFPPLIVKRVLASPGEALPPEVSEEESRLPPGRYFLTADNFVPTSSRYWFIPVESTDIKANAVLVVWPWRRWRVLK